MTEEPPVLFIEAVPFASRLHVLETMVRGCLNSGQRVRIHRPARKRDSDLDRFDSETTGANQYVDKRFQIESPRHPLRTRQVCGLLRNALRREKRSGGMAVVLTAIDDYPRALPLLALMLRFTPHIRPYFVRYRVNDLPQVSERRSGLQLVKRFVVALSTHIAGAQTVVFDERVPSSRSVHVAPDPWMGPFGGCDRSAARAELTWPADLPVVGLVGYQDHRKGFDLAVKLLEGARRRQPHLRAVIVGRVDPAFAADLGRLKESFGCDLLHEEKYLSEDEIALAFAGFSVTLLPYAASFTSTSGVLVRSIASRTPVLTTPHGLVGWRTRNYGLGEVLDPNDIEGGAEKLLELCRNGALPARARQFAIDCRSDVAETRFGAIFAASRTDS